MAMNEEFEMKITGIDSTFLGEDMMKFIETKLKIENLLMNSKKELPFDFEVSLAICNPIVVPQAPPPSLKPLHSADCRPPPRLSVRHLARSQLLFVDWLSGAEVQENGLLQIIPL